MVWGGFVICYKGGNINCIYVMTSYKNPQNSQF